MSWSRRFKWCLNELCLKGLSPSRPFVPFSSFVPGRIGLQLFVICHKLTLIPIFRSAPEEAEAMQTSTGHRRTMSVKSPKVWHHWSFCEHLFMCCSRGTPTPSLDILVVLYYNESSYHRNFTVNYASSCLLGQMHDALVKHLRHSKLHRNTMHIERTWKDKGQKMSEKRTVLKPRYWIDKASNCKYATNHSANLAGTAESLDQPMASVGQAQILLRLNGFLYVVTRG